MPLKRDGDMAGQCAFKLLCMGADTSARFILPAPPVTKMFPVIVWLLFTVSDQSIENLMKRNLLVKDCDKTASSENESSIT